VQQHRKPVPARLPQRQPPDRAEPGLQPDLQDQRPGVRVGQGHAAEPHLGPELPQGDPGRGAAQLQAAARPAFAVQRDQQRGQAAADEHAESAAHQTVGQQDQGGRQVHIRTFSLGTTLVLLACVNADMVSTTCPTCAICS